jgi:hypothetical protein
MPRSSAAGYFTVQGVHAVAKYIFSACVVIFAITTLSGTSFAAAEQRSSRPSLSGDAEFGATFFSWAPDYQAEAGRAILKFNTEGARLLRFQGNVGYDQMSFLSVSYERPISQTEDQQALIKANSTQETGIERFTGGIALDPFAAALFPSDSLGSRVMRSVLSLRYRTTWERFIGTATAAEAVAYLTPTTTIDYVNKNISGAQAFPKGQTLSFKSDFMDNEVSIALWSFTMQHFYNGSRVPFKESISNVRLGYYASAWERPAATTAITYNGQPVIYDAKFRARGIMLSVETADPGSPGLNIDFAFRTSTSASIDSPIDWNQAIQLKTNESLDVNSAQLDLSLWYNYYFSDRASGPAITTGVTIIQRAINVDVNATVTKSDGSSATQTTRLVHDTDAIRKFYVLLAYRF